MEAITFAKCRNAAGHPLPAVAYAGVPDARFRRSLQVLTSGNAGAHGREKRQREEGSFTLWARQICGRPTLISSRSATVDRGEKGDFVAVGGDGSLLCLRWPEGRLEGAETVVLQPVGVVGSVGSCRSRVWCPGVVGEAAAVVAQRNKSSRVLPPPPLVFLSGVEGELVEVVLPMWSSCTGGIGRQLVFRVRR